MSWEILWVGSEEAAAFGEGVGDLGGGGVGEVAADRLVADQRELFHQ